MFASRRTWPAHQRAEKLLLVVDGKLAGLITIKDLMHAVRNPNAVKDELGRLPFAVAIGRGPDRVEGAEAHIAADVDVLVVGTACGQSKGIIETVQDSKFWFRNVPIIAGNIATEASTQALIEAGADAVGIPQIGALNDCARPADLAGLPIIADGGIKHSCDVTKALAGGASSGMIGSPLAATDDAPGEFVLYQGRSDKTYRGMGSLGAMRSGSRDRHGQGRTRDETRMPGGIEGRGPHRGSLKAVVRQLVGGLRAGMGNTGCATIAQLREGLRFVRVTAQGQRESHVHDVMITEEAPNYRTSAQKPAGKEELCHG